MLIIASENDSVVPYLEHSKRFYKRLRKRKVETGYVVLEDGEHWRSNAAHELTKLRAIIEFVDRHIGRGGDQVAGSAN